MAGQLSFMGLQIWNLFCGVFIPPHIRPISAEVQIQLWWKTVHPITPSTPSIPSTPSTPSLVCIAFSRTRLLFILCGPLCLNSPSISQLLHICTCNIRLWRLFFLLLFDKIVHLEHNAPSAGILGMGCEFQIARSKQFVIENVTMTLLTLIIYFPQCSGVFGTSWQMIREGLKTLPLAKHHNYIRVAHCCAIYLCSLGREI